MAVSQDLFISLLNPVLSIVLSTAFFVLWSFRRENRYVLQLCVCYFAVAIGFALQSFDLGAGPAVSKVISNLLFFGALLLFVAAVTSRQGVRVPWAASLLCIAAGMGGLLWFLFVQPYFPGRVFSVNYGLGALCIVAMMRLRQSSRRSVIDRMIVLMAGLRAADFFIRPLLVALLSGVDAGRPPYMHSPYWLTTSLSVMVFSLLIALTLLTAVALDTINELQAESETDALSKLLNRRGFEQKAASVLERSARTGAPVTLVLADLDHFKSVNDRFGHAVGDQVIVEFAARLQTAGSRAVVGRIGGEEFAVLMPSTDLVAGRLFAETVREAFCSETVEGVPPGVKLTASFGVAGRFGGEELAPLMLRADEALYKAKQNGRDSVRISFQRQPIARYVDLPAAS
ncbi:MAG: GGDEF domain-containing protein [Aquamicrobium sp.]|uniref:GGDEF domain-containing protein n=1 Tax=Mesorhizobium sp. Pch-S TaxID=2082387 RepID=UPI0010139CE0|nr:GGDEF domain-containing protein [Mesorhizobium sp. Pch-S]MBR2690676.1 GGDEF domain-containing protein [Aquamicrobium sp.]QAZ43617.1 GGDEF domain-containing protein [Mesorhizobium sp. Pch-S]